MNRESVIKEVYKKSYFLENENYNEWLLRVTNSYVSGDLSERMQKYIKNRWFHPATPISSNAGTNRGLPISCFTTKTFDTKESIFSGLYNKAMLGAGGGGVGADYSSVREVHAEIKSKGDKKTGESSGIIPFIKAEESLSNAVSQGGVRRFNQAVYLDVSHPEIFDFINLKKETGHHNERTPQLSIGVKISDEFMLSVIHNKTFNLISPSSKKVVEIINARELWGHILQSRLQTGYPFIMFIDTCNRNMPDEFKKDDVRIDTSNLCVSGDTKILTKKYGYTHIKDVSGETLECWNGKEWSATKLFQTSEGQSVLDVKLSNSMNIKATPYHKWYVMDNYSRQVEKRTHELIPGDKLIKFNLEPIPHGNGVLPLAYVNGFHSGDGTVYKKSNKPRISLWDEKQVLLPRFSGFYSKTITKDGRILNLHYESDVLKDKFYIPDSTINVQDRLNWLAGYIDADGTLTDNNEAESIQVASIELPFLQGVLLLLQELGVHSTISKVREAGYRKLPLNDGTNGYGDYWCKTMYRLIIAGSELNKLLDLGFNASRVRPTRREYQRQARQFITVVSVVDNEEVIPTFCGSEELDHKLMFNGVLTGNCTEIMLPTTEDKDGVCCLGSLNLEFYEDYKNDLQQVVADCSDYLDAVLQDYINQASTMQGHEKAVNGAIDSRDLGLGVMGFHSLLISKNIPFESPMARGLNIDIFSRIKEASDTHQDSINQPCPMSLRVGSKRRNINVTAVAPTGSISTLCGLTSMGIEPIFDNITTKQIKQGVFTIKNKYLVAHLEKIGKNTKEVWKDILDNKGSVQHLDFLDDYTKAIYKTAYEINQQTILELAGDRAKLIDQAQSINLFIPYKPSAQYLSDLHMMAWKLGIKSLYYQRGSSTMEAGTSQVTRQVIEECTSCQ